MPLFRYRPLWRKPDAAETEFQKAAWYRNPKSKAYDLKLAFEHLRRAISLKPGDPKYHFELGYTYLQAPDLALRFGGDPGFKLSRSVELAIEAFEETLRLKPDHAGANLNLVLARCYMGDNKQALALANELKDRQAKKYATRLVEAQEKVSREKLAQAKSHFEQALTYRGMGRLRESDKEFQQGYTLLTYDLAALYRLMCDMAS